MPTICTRCDSQTKGGRRCMRWASCRSGCRTKCWQHAKDHLGRGRGCADADAMQQLRRQMRSLEGMGADGSTVTGTLTEGTMEKILNRLRPRKSDRARFVDVGSADGIVLAIAAAKGYSEATGIEIMNTGGLREKFAQFKRLVSTATGVTMKQRYGTDAASPSVNLNADVVGADVFLFWEAWSRADQVAVARKLADAGAQRICFVDRLSEGAHEEMLNAGLRNINAGAGARGGAASTAVYRQYAKLTGMKQRVSGDAYTARFFARR